MVRIVSPKGTGFPDYTDILHRISVETYKEQSSWYWAAVPPFYFHINTNTWYVFQINPNIPENRELFLNTVVATVPSTRLLTLEIYSKDGDLVEKASEYQKVVFSVKEGIKYYHNTYIVIKVCVHATTTTTEYLTLYCYGLQQKRGVSVL